MGRSLVLANENLHISLNPSGEIADIFFPYVGLESHIGPRGLAHKLGVFVDGALHWTSDNDWAIEVDYHDGALIGDTVATNKNIGVVLECTDTVDPDRNVFVRSIHVVNLRDKPRELKLFVHQAYTIADSESSMTAQYRPDLPGIMHYRGNRVFITGLQMAGEPFDDYSIGCYDHHGNGTFRDAENGRLSKNPVDNGKTDSVLACSFRLEPHSSARADQVLVAAESTDIADQLLTETLSAGIRRTLTAATDYWYNWLAPARRVIKHLSSEDQRLFERSLLIIKAHTGANGAVMASLDNSLRSHPQNDTYAFCWGRDSVYILWPLLRLGYREEVLAYFGFVSRTLRPGGYVSHKYQADGSRGTSWLPYEHADETVHEPIQADETASNLFLFGQYYRLTGDQQTIASYYESTVSPMANFLADYTERSGLPRPSYHIWEHDYLSTTYTTAVTYAALLEAAELANVHGRSEDSERWRHAAELMREAAPALFDTEKQLFSRGVRQLKDGELLRDSSVDAASIYGAFMYGLVGADTTEFQSALAITKSKLHVKNDLYARFENDDYCAVNSTSNAWPLVSLWFAEIAAEQGDYEEAERILNSVRNCASPAGLLPEQLTSDKLEPVSVCPLVWSHAEYVSVQLDMLPYYINKAREAYEADS